MRKLYRNFSNLLLVTALALCVQISLPYQALAGETVETMTSGSVTYNTNELHRVGSKIIFNAAPSLSDIEACDGSDPDVTCPPAFFSPSTVNVEYECMGYSSAYPNGGWALNTGGADQCWSALRVCYFEGTPSEVCTDIGPQTLSDTNNENVTYDDACTQGDPALKDYCAINYEPGLVANGPSNITGDTGDDMFKIPPALPKSQGYFVYKRPADPDYELRFFKRNTGSARDDTPMMVPSGPFTDFSDFKKFVSAPPSMIDIEGGCYPVEINLCQGGAPPPAPVGCTLGPLVEVGTPSMPWPSGMTTWDGWAGDMSSPGPGNFCQGANYVATSAGGTQTFNDYGGNCGSLVEGDFSPTGKCIDRVEANCGGNLSCASNCSVLVRNCAAAPPPPTTCGTVQNTALSYEVGGMVLDCTPSDQGGNLGLNACSENYSTGDQVTDADDIAAGMCAYGPIGATPSTCAWKEVIIANGGSACP